MKRWKKEQVIAELEKDELKTTVERFQSELAIAWANHAARKSLGPDATDETLNTLYDSGSLSEQRAAFEKIASSPEQ